MTIQPSIIAAGPTVARADTKAFAGHVAPVPPPAFYESVDENGDYVLVNQPADFEGRIVFHRAGDTRSLQAYVAVQAERGLQWKPVRLGATVNSFTGEPYDPLAGFYNPLAS